MNKFKKIGLYAAAFLATLVMASPAYAAADRVKIERVVDVSDLQPNTAIIQAIFFDGSNSNIVDEPTTNIVVASGTPIGTNAAFLSELQNWAQSYSFDRWGTTIATSSISWDGWGVINSTQMSSLLASQPVALSFANPTRSLNSAFQVSTTRAAAVSYTVDVATTLSLTGGATGTITLQYADDSGFTTNVKTVQSSVNGNTGALTIGLTLTQTSTAALTGIIPAGKYVKIVTANTAGTPTFTYRAAQEVLLANN